MTLTDYLVIGILSVVVRWAVKTQRLAWDEIAAFDVQRVRDGAVMALAGVAVLNDGATVTLPVPGRRQDTVDSLNGELVSWKQRHSQLSGKPQ